jgi:hypothetical protein
MPEKQYNHQEIELKWQARWSGDADLYRPSHDKTKRQNEAEVLRARNASLP